jgi:hypothetical protein
MAQVSLFAALMAVMGLIPKIDLPFGVPITIQSLGVMLAGVMLGPGAACSPWRCFSQPWPWACPCCLAAAAASASSWHRLPAI